MTDIKKLGEWDTQLYADCVEFCPFEPFQSLAACGTYQLCESESTRLGRLSLHSIDSTEVADLSPFQLVEGPGILDLKWCRKPIASRTVVLAVANAIGQIVLHALDDDNGSFPRLAEHHVASIGSCLALSCDWFDGEQLVVSDSNGSVSRLSVSPVGSTVVNTWKAHDFEAWVASFDRHNGNLIYSGGDDSRFRLWDMRTDPISPIWTLSKAHQMGVTSIETSPFDCNLLATGSYDERLLLWDKRQMKTPASETPLGGGVWKLRWEPAAGNHLLAAAMHNGFHIVDCKSQSLTGLGLPASEPSVVATYMEHSSLAYGCDWSRKPASGSRKTIATCSFYDHSLHVWTWGP